MANSIRKRRGLMELQSNCAFVGRKVSTSAISSTQSLRAAKLHVELHLRPAHPEALEQYFHRKRLTGYRPPLQRAAHGCKDSISVTTNLQNQQILCQPCQPKQLIVRN